MDVEQDTYVHLLKQLLRTCLKHVQQLQQLAGNGYEGPFFPDSLPLSALEQLFAMTWESCTATPELSMKSIVKEVAEVVEGSAADIHVRIFSASFLKPSMCECLGSFITKRSLLAHPLCLVVARIARMHKIA